MKLIDLFEAKKENVTIRTQIARIIDGVVKAESSNLSYLAGNTIQYQPSRDTSSWTIRVSGRGMSKPMDLNDLVDDDDVELPRVPLKGEVFETLNKIVKEIASKMPLIGIGISQHYYGPVGASFSDKMIEFTDIENPDFAKWMNSIKGSGGVFNVKFIFKGFEKRTPNGSVWTTKGTGDKNLKAIVKKVGNLFFNLRPDEIPEYKNDNRFAFHVESSENKLVLIPVYYKLEWKKLGPEHSTAVFVENYTHVSTARKFLQNCLDVNRDKLEKIQSKDDVKITSTIGLLKDYNSQELKRPGGWMRNFDIDEYMKKVPALTITIE